MHHPLKHFLVVAGVVAASATAWSQQPPRGSVESAPGDGEANEIVLKTQFLEAHKAKKWAEAREAFVTMRRNFPLVAQDKRMVYLFAEAQYNLREPDGATQTLEKLLELQDNHARGLFLLAQIKAKSNNTQDKERAKDLLIQAARAGLYVLRDISSAEGKAVFGFLLTDPAFILRVMHAANEYQITSTDVHNPFISALLPHVEGLVEPVVTVSAGDPRQAELEERIENLFQEIVKLAEERQVEELITKFTELRQIMNEYQGFGTAEVKKKLEKWGQKLADLGEIQYSIRLQVYIAEGNQHLRSMADAIRGDLFDAALEQFNQIEALCDQMRAEDREVFHRNAEALFLRGKALADRARRLKRIAEFRLVVTGIVIAPPGDKEDSAIINNRIYREGDTVFDDTDEEIEGLRVVEIIRSTVRFRFEDTEFVRELKPQQ
ncbi:MAG: hypothetical protein KF878_23185 [Planctomycetes bacterium]|nr:hypothetical protein [Planctomycetota bacterium]